MSKSWIRRYRIPLSFVFVIAVFFWANPTPPSALLGLPMVIFGGSLRTWSSGYIRKNKELAMDGPYSITRNPLYLGSFFIGFGFSIMASELWIIILFLSSFLTLYYVVVKDEETALLQRFGEVYRSYGKSVPRFFPRWTNRIQTGQFTWQLVMKHREYYAWGGISLGFLWIFWKI